MTAPAFTPGPWSLDPQARDYATFDAPLLGTIRGSGGKPDGGEHIALVVGDLLEAATANANLIAAAPELYAQLEEWAFLVEGGQLKATSAHAFAHDTRQLLAKARGEQVPNA